MQDTTPTDVGSIYGVVLREVESDAIQELPPDFYQAVSRHMDGLRRAEYDGVEAKVKDALVEMMAGLVRLLFRLRMEKASPSGDRLNLLDAERYVIYSEDQMREREDLMLGAILDGRTRLLDAASWRHKTELVPVRFLGYMDQFVGSDMEGYGPYDAEDVASIPRENAQALVSQGTAENIRYDE